MGQVPDQVPDQVPPESPARRLRAQALRLLAQREHCRAELERKLLRRVAGGRSAAADAGDDAESCRRTVASVLDELQHHGLLSDERAAAALLAARAVRHGPLRLQQDLRGRGFAADLVEATVHEARRTETERARAVWQRRFGLAPADAADRARQLRFLAGRGFSAEVAARVLREAGSGGAEDLACP